MNRIIQLIYIFCLLCITIIETSEPIECTFPSDYEVSYECYKLDKQKPYCRKTPSGSSHCTSCISMCDCDTNEFCSSNPVCVFN